MLAGGDRRVGARRACTMLHGIWCCQQKQVVVGALLRAAVSGEGARRSQEGKRKAQAAYVPRNGHRWQNATQWKVG